MCHQQIYQQRYLFVDSNQFYWHLSSQSPLSPMFFLSHLSHFHFLRRSKVRSWKFLPKSFCQIMREADNWRWRNCKILLASLVSGTGGTGFGWEEVIRECLPPLQMPPFICSAGRSRPHSGYPFNGRGTLETNFFCSFWFIFQSFQSILWIRKGLKKRKSGFSGL